MIIFVADGTRFKDVWVFGFWSATKNESGCAEAGSDVVSMGLVRGCCRGG